MPSTYRNNYFPNDYNFEGNILLENFTSERITLKTYDGEILLSIPSKSGVLFTKSHLDNIASQLGKDTYGFLYSLTKEVPDIKIRS